MNTTASKSPVAEPGNYLLPTQSRESKAATCVRPFQVACAVVFTDNPVKGLSGG